jgi:transposase-like protein
MDQRIREPSAGSSDFLDAGWFDPIEVAIRDRVRGFIETLVEAELDEALGRSRYQRLGTADQAGGIAGSRHGRRERQLLGSFGPVTISVPRARLSKADGTSWEWHSAALPRYARMTKQVEALIAGAYLSGTNTRRVRRALGALFKGAVSKDTVSRTWRKVQADWEAWCHRSLAEEDVVRLILDGTVVRVRLDRKATSISLLVVLGIRRDGQKVLLAVRNMGGESEAAWRSLLDDLVSRGLPAPNFVIIDGAAGLEKALGLVWSNALVQRCTVHKHRNLLAHAPERLHEEISADYNHMIYAGTPKEIETRRKSFVRKWRLKCRAVPIAWRKPGTGCSPSPVCPTANGDRHAPQMPSSGCTRSSSAVSRRKRCYPRQRLLPCCSGHCLHAVRSPCAK